MPIPTNAAGMPTNNGASEAMFYSILDAEMRKIESFTHLQVGEVRKKLRSLEANMQTSEVFQLLIVVQLSHQNLQ